MDKFIKVSVKNELPLNDGKYIVYTRTHMGNEHILATNFNLKNKQPHWSCNNQIVTHWLKRIG